MSSPNPPNPSSLFHAPRLTLHDLAEQAEALRHALAHRAYHAGVDDVIRRLASEDADHPYLLYKTKGDKKTRPSHAAMSGKVAHRDSPLADEFRALLEDYNCRCTLVPLTTDQARRRGIDDNTGAVEEEEEDEVAVTGEAPASSPGSSASTTPPADPPKPLTKKEQKQLQKIWAKEADDKARMAQATTVTDKLAQYKTGDRVAAFLSKTPPVPKRILEAPTNIHHKELAPLEKERETLDKRLMRSPRKGSQPRQAERLRIMQRRHQELTAKIDDAKKKKKRAEEEIERAQKTRREAMALRLALPNSRQSPINATVDPKLPQSQQNDIDTSRKWLTKIVQKRQWNRTQKDEQVLHFEQLQSFHPLDRSHYDKGNIRLDADADETVVVHESGHDFDDEPAVSKAAKEFVRARTAGQPREKLNAKFPNSVYKANEETLGDDNWTRLFTAFGYSDAEAQERAAYVGKTYGSQNATEVISVGMELMRKDPALFADTDREYFKLVLAAMRGAL